MTRTEYELKMQSIKSLNGAIKYMALYITSLEATIEVQEIIIKDKSDIIEAMAQPKTCSECKHFTPSSTQHFELCTYDFDCSDDYKPLSRYEPKDNQ